MSKQILFFISWFCITTFISFEIMAQSSVSKNEQATKELDSLWNVYKEAKKSVLEDTAQINRLLDVSSCYIKLKNDSSRVLAETVIHKSEEQLYFSGMAKAVRIIGLYHQQKSNYDSAIHFFKASSDLYQEVGDSVEYSMVLNNLAGVYYVQGNYERALENLLVALGIQQRYDKKLQVSRALNNMALIYKRNNQYEKAIQMHKQAIVMKEKLNDNLGIVVGYLNIGSVYFEQEDYLSTIDYLKKGLALAIQLNDNMLLCQYYITLGRSTSKLDSLKNSANSSRGSVTKSEIVLLFIFT